MTELTFPPLMHGEACTADPMDHAAMRAVQGCDAGLIAHRLGANTLEAAIVFAPEVPLEQAAIILPLCGIGFQNALGALAPPEVAVHLEWGGGLRVNGASCGRLQAMSDTGDPSALPDWLVVSLSLPLWPSDDDADAAGHAPDRTTLYAEGCADVEPPRLLEAWARHTLNWIGRWEDAGTKPVHAEWRGLAHGVGEDARQGGSSGTFLGVDEHFGMLLRDAETTHLIPLSSLVRTP
ncbi:Biotin--protein ligase [Candidatus Rhodobacter oscarellae]|uniref:Biotin--protein ligase n=1 Tax=Candidatus Rhodobacter oscarellae TaxID=1675527 RepID=A0A0J9GSQ1_9RHOB|nr:biotin/lipoate--protein ligase family protein [Candidatus Rhodobacter lobularis]KMW56528.1 Biotin--protein ligase [Candidatus Rhodobacter lobularis]